MKKIRITKIDFVKKNIYLIIALLSLPAVRYLFIKGFFGVSDDLHVAWLFEMDRAIKTLQFPPRFVPDLSYNFGYPLFTFVYPLPFYIGEFFHMIGFSLVNSLKLVFGLSIPFSMFFMYKLLKSFVSEKLALAGGVLYVYAPYRATEIFVRGSVGEIVGFAIFPFLVWSVLKKKWGAISLSVALLVLSHNIMAYMFFSFLAILILLQIIFVEKKKLIYFKKIILWIGLGLLASIYFWLPALYESRLFQYSTVFNFYDHFPTLKQLITPFFGYGASVAGPYDTMSFYVGLLGVAVFVLGSIVFVTNYKKFKMSEKVFLLWLLIILFTSVFMMNYRSAFLWERVPLLPYFQFPWRFLAPVTFTLPLFLIPFSKINTKFSSAFGFLVIILAIILNFNYFKFSEYLGREDYYYLNRYIPSAKNVSQEYKQTSEEYLRLPKSNIKRPEKVYKRAFTDFDAEIEIEELNSLDAKIKTNSESDFLLNYNKYYYPGWSVLIDGKKTAITPGMPFGQISFIVPEGEHDVLVEYKESPTRLIFDIISLIAFAGIIAVLVKDKK